ncbi:S-adenosylmethionine-dependent methyltransferase KNAG_0M00170 [Huiozyma naganishii CBS 8797]|uniref:Histone-lysine N-methyltransferase SET5 n=1 Tax=Huiozyma naganishii (strain ATCC MYA-139 / BCRC 22969 / CBS 8797 / KCTC 17520 / NBRC 10181 / NCYC 3082 / Yp74L-3) TaxID=1071383 RepID=J7RDA6_HUIN7|nr:hypothetical protein KNAG_0M00170 [Kazachstania naganishii CBS 8797]CCK72870.1 hypothetical protein KNAG_0M00170 [Kazachstania naganishii CBS 8797]
MPMRIKVLSLNDSEDLQSQDGSRPTTQMVCDDVVLLWKEEPGLEYCHMGELFERVSQRHPEWELTKEGLEELLADQNLRVFNEEDIDVYGEEIETPSLDSIRLDDKNALGNQLEIKDTPHMGRGLFSLKDFNAGDLLIKDLEPICLIPPMEKLTLMQNGKACSLCGQSIANINSHFIVINGLDCNDCQAVWCSKKCKLKDIIHAPLTHNKGKNKLVNGGNWRKFEKFCSDNVFVAAYSLGIMFSKYLLTKSKEAQTIKKKFDSLAFVSQRTRAQYSDSSNIGGTLDASDGVNTTADPEPKWKEGYQLFIDTFPSLKEEVDYERFLEYIGRFNLNAIAEQLYYIPSFINHNCEPNVRFEKDSRLHINFYARKDIKKGEQIFMTYCNPLHEVNLRRRELRVNYGFLCFCDRCRKEVKTIKRTNKAVAENKLHVVERLPDSHRRKSSLRSKRPDLEELMRNGKEFELEIPDVIGSGKRRTSVRFDTTVSLAFEE